MKKSSKTALAAAVDLLALRSHSEKMLLDKLRRKGYEAEEAAAAVAALVARGYVDDAELCAFLYRRYAAEARASLRQIEAKLLRQGFAEELVKSCRDAGDAATERTAAMRALRGRYASPDRAEPLRMMQYLYGKGFGRDAIRRAVAEFAGRDAADFPDACE